MALMADDPKPDKQCQARLAASSARLLPQAGATAYDPVTRSHAYLESRLQSKRLTRGATMLEAA